MVEGDLVWQNYSLKSANEIVKAQAGSTRWAIIYKKENLRKLTKLSLKLKLKKEDIMLQKIELKIERKFY